MAYSDIRLNLADEDDLAAAHELANGRTDIELLELGGAGDGLQPEAVEPVSAILIAGGVIAATKFVLDWWERRKGGLVIDLRPDVTERISRDGDLPYGYVVVFTADSAGRPAVTVEVKDAPKDVWERLLTALVEGVFSSAEDVVAEVSKIVGADRVSTEAGTPPRRGSV
jgi:hypothetical protein